MTPSIHGLPRHHLLPILCCGLLIGCGSSVSGSKTDTGQRDTSPQPDSFVGNDTRPVPEPGPEAGPEAGPEVVEDTKPPAAEVTPSVLDAPAVDAPIAVDGPPATLDTPTIDAAPIARIDAGAGGQGGTRGACGSSAGGTTGGGGVVYPFAPIPGYGWVNLGIGASVTSPTCGGAPISGQSPAPFAMAPIPSCPVSSLCWDVVNPYFPNALCISGSIPALPANPVQQDYAENWGVMLGYTFTAPIPAAYQSITFAANESYSPSGNLLRTAIHLKGDPDDVVYCTAMDPTGAMVPFTNFHAPCRDTPGAVDKSLRNSDVPNIDRVGVLIEPGASAFTVTNLCFWFVSFNSGLTGTGGATGMFAGGGLPGTGGANGNSAF